MDQFSSLARGFETAKLAGTGGPAGQGKGGSSEGPRAQLCQLVLRLAKSLRMVGEEARAAQLAASYGQRL